MNQISRRMLNCLKATALSVALSLGSAANAEDTAAEVFENNPLLASLNARDQTVASETLDEIEAILKQPQDETLPKQTSRGAPEFREILEQNPILQEAYRRDPRATAKLIGIIRPVNN